MRLIGVACFFLLSFPVLAQTTLTGTVTDASAKPLSGVSVHILNSSAGTSTDDGGNFTLTNVAAGMVRIEFSAVGYAAVIRTLQDGETPAPLAVSLKEEALQLDEVVVTAQKKEEVLQEIPVSISAFTAKDVRQFRLWNSKDLSVLVPNLYVANPGDNRNVISLRGITSTSYDPAVATYVDGVNQFTLDTYIAQLFDVERVEVLRGPQGTLYGRNAMGGVVNIITKQPTNKAQGFLELNAGSYGQTRFVAGGRTPLIKNKLYLGATLLSEGADGFYKNEFDNTDFDTKRSITGNYYLKFMASPTWNFTLNVKHSANRNKGTFPLASSFSDALSNPFKVNQNAVSTMHDDIFNGSLAASHHGAKVNFTSLTTYQSNYRYYDKPIDGDFSPIDGVTIINDYGRKWNNVNVWTQEFKLTSATPSSALQWTAGVYAFAQSSPNKQTTFFGADGTLVGSPANNVGVENTTQATSKGIAGFGQATYRVNEKVDFTAGLRYDYERKTQSVSGNFVTLPFPTVVFVLRPDTSASASFNAVSPRVGMSYHVNNNTHLYVNYTRGFRAGGLTAIGADPSQPPLYSYKPENSNNLEISLKNTALDNRLRFNLTGYYININNAQIPSLILPQALTITRNAGKLVSTGVELETAATLLGGLEALWNAGITNAHYTDLKLAQFGSVVNLDGSKQLFTPASTNLIALQYTRPISGNKLSLVGRVEWSHVGKQFFDLANQLSQSGYNLVNARAGFIMNDIEVMVWARNLGDTRYVSYAYDFGAAHLGDPFNVGITIRKNFR